MFLYATKSLAYQCNHSRILTIMGLLDNNTNQAVSEPSAPHVKSMGKKKTILSLLGVIMLLAAAIGGSIYIVKAKPELLGLAKPPEGSQEDVSGLVESVSKIINLPLGEMPTVATVSDLSKTQDKEFFKNAKEGDKVLIYQGAKKAYLYRPSEKKIIEVGAVSVPEPTGVVAGEETETIEVITPTPLSTATPNPTREVSPTETPTPILNQ